MIWLVRLKLRLEEVWEVLSKGMLSVVKGINGNDGFVLEVDGKMFGFIMVCASGRWISFG